MSQSEQEEPISNCVLNNQWILKARPDDCNGNLDPSNTFVKQSQKLDDLQDGHVLARVLCVLVEPINIGWICCSSTCCAFDDMEAVKIGDTIRAMGLAQVMDSKHKHYQKGEIIHGVVGWQEYIVFDPNDKSSSNPMKFFKPPSMDHHLSLDTLACMPSALVAYFAINAKTKIRSSDAVLISGAAGATGHVAGQVAKFLGANMVVGLVDSPEQSEWITSCCRFDAAIDTSQQQRDLNQQLQELFPKGVNVFLDTVGGHLLDTVLLHLAHGARVVLCGASSQYNHQQKPYGIQNTMSLIAKRTTVYGFQLDSYKGQFMEGILTLGLWIKFKRLEIKVVDQQQGLDALPFTLQSLSTDSTITGNQVIKLADPPLPIHTNWWFQAFIKGLTVVAFVRMMDKLVNFVEERAEDKAIDQVTGEVEAQSKKKKKKKQTNNKSK